MEHLIEYRKVQSIAKDTIAELKHVIKAGITEREIVMKAEEIMRNKGIESFWYHGIGAFVQVGKRTAISESGSHYVPSETVVGRNDIVTVDLSPELHTFWGDYARTIIVVDGQAMDDRLIGNASEFSQGFRTGEELHKAFIEFVKPNMTFEEVYLYINEVIQHLGYINLDFSGNLGHSIEFDKDRRTYFELGNKTKLNEVSYFTFEPHIKRMDGEHGYKREDIYYFQNEEIVVL